MNILCLLIVPLFFAAVVLYFQTWMNVEDFWSVFKFLMWGLIFGIIYAIGGTWLNAPFYNKIAWQAVLTRCICIDGLAFSFLFIASFYGLCKAYETDSSNMWSASAVACFGYVCGVLTILNLLTFLKSEYTHRYFTYIPYLLCYVSVCICAGFFYAKISEADGFLPKFLLFVGSVVACAVLPASYNFMMFLGGVGVYFLCVIYAALIIVFYILDFMDYGDSL